MSERTMTCEDVQAAAPELALGMVSGTERAAALEHLVGCATCRAEVESLSDVADALLVLAPQAEPPLGFESRVVDRLAGAGLGVPARSRRRWRLTTVAAVTAVILGVAVGFSGLYERDRGNALDREYVNALRVLGGTALHAGRLTDVEGRPTGEVFVYDGNPSWIFVTVSDPHASGPLTVELRRTGRRPTTLTGLTVSGGTGSLGQRLAGPTGEVASVRVRGPGVDYMGHFDGRPGVAGRMP
jgi:hypothetical protein